MKNVLERMRENQSEKKIADFRVKQQQPYWFKKDYAAIRAREFYDHPDITGMCYVAVGGLDSITLFLFLHSIGIKVPAVSVSFLEDKSVQRVHKGLGVRCLQPALRADGSRWSKASVIREFGFPVLSKEIAGKIDTLQHPTEKKRHGSPRNHNRRDWSLWRIPKRHSHEAVSKMAGEIRRL